MGLVAARRRASSTACAPSATGVGALLIFDEVITGFRVGRGGAQERYGVTPDLSSFGKVIGGGLPSARSAAGPTSWTSSRPLGPVYQAGTLSGNPLATAAGLAALALLDDDAYRTLAATGRAAGRRPRQARSTDAGLTVRVLGRGPAGRPVLRRPTAPVDYADARGTDEPAYAAFFHAMLDRGVALAPGAYEVLFPGLAHDDAVVSAIIERAGEAAASIAGG